MATKTNQKNTAKKSTEVSTKQWTESFVRKHIKALKALAKK